MCDLWSQIAFRDAMSYRRLAEESRILGNFLFILVSADDLTALFEPKLYIMNVINFYPCHIQSFIVLYIHLYLLEELKHT